MNTALTIIITLAGICWLARHRLGRWKRLLFFGLSLFTNGRSQIVRIFGRASEMIETEYEDEGKKYPLRIFQPHNARHPLPAVIMYHGATPFGLEHPTMNLLAQNLVRLNVRVFYPLLPHLANMKLSPLTIPRMKRFYQQVEKRDDILPDKILISGFSFSGGMVLKLSTDPEINPAGVISYGSYYDLESTLRFFFTGQAQYKSTRVEIVPHEYTKAVWFWNYIDRLNLPFETDLPKKAIDEFIRRDAGAAEKICATGTQEQQVFLKHVFTPNDPDSMPYMEEALPHHRAEIESISPRYFVKDLKNPIFIVHGSQDNMVPYTENLALTAALAEYNKQFYSHLIRLFGHVEANKSSLWGLIKEIKDLIKLLVRMVKTIE